MMCWLGLNAISAAVAISSANFNLDLPPGMYIRMEKGNMMYSTCFPL